LVTEKLSQPEQLKKFFAETIEGGHKVTDKHSADDLVKLGLEHIKRGHSHREKAKKALSQVLQDKGITIADKGFSKSVSGLNVKLTKPPVSPDAIPETSATESKAPAISWDSSKFESADLPKGALPKSDVVPEIEPETTERPPKKTLDPEIKKEYETMLQKGFSFIGKAYIKLGIVEAKTVEEEKPMTQEEFVGDCEALGKSVADYCYRHGVELPTWVEAVFLGGFAFSVLGMPIINALLSGRNKKKQPPVDDTLKDVDIKSGEKKEELTTAVE